MTASGKLAYVLVITFITAISCSKSTSPDPEPPLPDPPSAFLLKSTMINETGVASGTVYTIPINPRIRFTFGKPVDKNSVAGAIAVISVSGTTVTYSTAYENNDSVVIVTPSQPLDFITKYQATVGVTLKAKDGGTLKSPVVASFITTIDSADKYTRITDDALLETVQKQTFKYFWDFGHPVSGLSRERNSSGDVCTTGGTGFGIMSMLVAVEHNFISRADALQRIHKIVSFYKNNCIAYHGAFAHWVNGSTGATVPFSPKDNGADLVETAYLMQGLLCARQYFALGSSEETSLRADINILWNAVEWQWFQQNNQDVLYWHWSPDYNWDMNMKITGWNEALIVYALAAASNTSPISKAVYDNGWAANGGIKNGNNYYGIQLPLGPAMGGPLFFAHYSFLGINPNSLSDAYASYWAQQVAHTKINYSYCVTNPARYNGYGTACWGLTASDEKNGYNAHAPGNDNGTISPTAAVSSLPYAPAEAMNALRFFYYTMGDKLWGEYGFIDAFNLSEPWFADSYLAIDQGPMIIMIENYKTGLLWNLLMSCAEIKTGMKKLGFQSPYL